ncbi:hypothetical protein [Pseudomonas sp.]
MSYEFGLRGWKVMKGVSDVWEVGFVRASLNDVRLAKPEAVVNIKQL